jgi:hypothetical protein
MSARAIEHPDVDMVAAPAGKDTGEKQRHSHAAGKALQNTAAAAGDYHP